MLRVELPYATFGIIFNEESMIAIAAAPIARWTIGKAYWQIMNYYCGKAVLTWIGS